MILHIKNMVCHRCKMVVEAELQKLELHPVSIALGEVVLEEKKLPAKTTEALKTALVAVGFELLDDKKSKLMEQIRNFIIESVHYNGEPSPLNFSRLLARHTGHDYSYISKLFSEVEGITIEQYQIQQKIEKVKELLLYNEIPLSQIAFDLGYSSTAHLSTQFKKSTGLTPTQFKQMGVHSRKSLDDVGKPE
jgi:AraC family transcriptional regulator